METDKIGERCYATYGQEIGISNLLYVDDIVELGNPIVMENTARNLKLLEERKKFTFSNIKNVIVKIGNKDRGPKTKVNKGWISLANTTKYLG